MSDQVRDVPHDVGERIRVDIPDETHPDHDHHGKNGEIIAVIPDAGQRVRTADADSVRYRVALDTGGTVDVRPYHVRPPI